MWADLDTKSVKMIPDAFPVVRFCTSPLIGKGPKRSSMTKEKRGGGLQAFKRKITHHLIVFLFNSIAADGFKQKCGTDMYS